GQVDRLAITETEVVIVDYKTNRPPPRRSIDVDPAYVFQMAVYRAALAEIYPRHTIRCVLLWTDGPFTLELSPTQLDTALMPLASCPSPPSSSISATCCGRGTAATSTASSSRMRRRWSASLPRFARQPGMSRKMPEESVPRPRQLSSQSSPANVR